MSTDTAGSTPSMDRFESTETPASKVRDTAEAMLADPNRAPTSAARFAGRMFAKTRISPPEATALYQELTDGAQSAAEAVESNTADGSDSEDAAAAAASDPAAVDANANAGNTRDTDPFDGMASLEEYFEILAAADVYQQLGSIGDRHQCSGNQDFIGWYHSRDVGGAVDGEARPFALGREFDAIRADLDRVLYATINYTPVEWYADAWTPYEWGNSGRDFEGEKPTPGYGDIAAIAPFADIDLEDDVKQQRPEGEIPRERIEAALADYIDAFAELAGGREHVFALDSVGGAYVMIAPTATEPIFDTFDRGDRARIFEEFVGRVNDWLEDVDADIVADSGLEGIFEADLLNNTNRLYKAPLSPHSSLDGVVTPVDTDDHEYCFMPFGDIDGELLDATHEWARGFTGDHRDAIGSIIDTLFEEHADAGDGWKAALRAWLEADSEAEEQQDRHERDRADIDASEIPDDLEVTDEIDVIEAKIEAIDVKDLIDDVIGKAVDTGTKKGDGIRFDPSWRGSNSGQSCFADSKKFADPKAGHSGGGALEFIALHNGIGDVRNPGDAPTGDAYWRAVNALREKGCDIPYFEGKGDRKHADVLRLFEEPEDEEEKKRQLARSLFCTGDS